MSQTPTTSVPVEKEPYGDIKELQRKVTYPDLAKRAGIEGKVNIRVLVGKEWCAEEAHRGINGFGLTERCRHQGGDEFGVHPAIQNNQPIDCWVSIPIVFRLR